MDEIDKKGELFEFKKFMSGFYSEARSATMDYESRMESQKWFEMLAKLPGITVPDGCTVSLLPPFLGAVARCQIKNRATGACVSVYLDCYNHLGIYPGPYWEMYPYWGNGDDTDAPFGDNQRYAMEDIAGLNEGIAASIKRQDANASDV